MEPILDEPCRDEEEQWAVAAIWWGDDVYSISTLGFRLIPFGRCNYFFYILKRGLVKVIPGTSLVVGGCGN